MYYVHLTYVESSQQSEVSSAYMWRLFAFCQGCYWTVESEGEERYVQISLEKKEMGHESWTNLIEGDGPDESFTNFVCTPFRRCSYSLDVTLPIHLFALADTFPMPPCMLSKVYFSIKVGEEDVGNLVMGLHGHIAPKTVENFLGMIIHSSTDIFPRSPPAQTNSRCHRSSLRELLSHPCIVMLIPHQAVTTLARYSIFIIVYVAEQHPCRWRAWPVRVVQGND